MTREVLQQPFETPRTQAYSRPHTGMQAGRGTRTQGTVDKSWNPTEREGHGKACVVNYKHQRSSLDFIIIRQLWHITGIKI
jgi:hypothetical protein